MRRSRFEVSSVTSVLLRLGRAARPVRAAVPAAVLCMAALTTAPAHTAEAAPTPPPPRILTGTGSATSDTTMTAPAPLTASVRRQLDLVKATATTTRAGGRIGALAPVLGTFAWATPVKGTHQTSGFGTRWGRVHAGADFAGPVGLPIRSVCGGTVTFAGPQGSYGNKVEVRCWDGSATAYGHMNAVQASVGQQVQPGARVGQLGNSGRSTGPHLHFEVRPDGTTPVDPIPWMDARGIHPVDTPAPAAPRATTKAAAKAR